MNARLALAVVAVALSAGAIASPSSGPADTRLATSSVAISGAWLVGGWDTRGSPVDSVYRSIFYGNLFLQGSASENASLNLELTGDVTAGGQGRHIARSYRISVTPETLTPNGYAFLGRGTTTMGRWRVDTAFPLPSDAAFRRGLWRILLSVGPERVKWIYFGVA